MNKQEFFRCTDTIVYTAESLVTYITSVLPYLQDDYNLGELVIGRSTSNKIVNHFPTIFLPITSKEYPDLQEVVIYIPEVNLLATYFGKVPFTPLGKEDVGRTFDVLFDDGVAKGEVGERAKEICLIYHKAL